MKDYEVVIGLEVHVELATKTKIFCGCSTEFGGAPNSHTCPVCTGMPGSLPVLNKKVVEYAAAVGLATNCTITQDCKFDRKNYFYPDLPYGFHFVQTDIKAMIVIPEQFGPRPEFYRFITNNPVSHSFIDLYPFQSALLQIA